MNSQPPADKPAAISDSATPERMMVGEADPIDTGDCSQAEILLEIAASTEFFHTADKTGFADITVNAHRECWPIRSKGFHRWLARQFYALTKGAPNPAALNQALAVCQARAHFDGPEREVGTRRTDPTRGFLLWRFSDAGPPARHRPSWAGAFAERELRKRNIPPVSPGSVRLRAGQLDHLGPFLRFVGDKLAELSDRHRHRLGAKLGNRALILGPASPVLISPFSF